MGDAHLEQKANSYHRQPPMLYHGPSMSTSVLLPTRAGASLLGLVLVAMAVAFVVVPPACRLAHRMGWVDRPTTRKDHSHPIPLLGGAAVYMAFLIAMALPWAVRDATHGIPALLAATWVSLLGLLDDHRALDVSLKLGGQVAAVAILVVGGIQVQLPLPSVVNLFLTLLWVLGITNAFNLLDNMDGLSGGLAALAAGSISILAFFEGQLWVASVAAALAGACAGFVIHNFAPARIFLGDSGSLLVGFLLAVLGIEMRFLENTSKVTWMVPILLLGLPIFDTTLVVFSRLRRGLNPLTSPGRDHVSHRLVRLGLSKRAAVLCLWGVAICLSLLAAMVSRSGPGLAYGIGFGTLAVGIVALLWLDQPSRRGLST
jgi:UDP-GlcNAc:undecaprenyl-phosphate GlcNAc-1-phosphate transferase